MLKQEISKIFFGRLKFQSFFEALYRVSLLGMNIGDGSNCKSSGEIGIIKSLVSKLSREKNTVIFDVGANKGEYTCLLNELLPKNVTIYSFEPSHATFLELQEKISDKNRIKLNNFGFSDRSEKVYLYSDKKGSGLASVYHRKLDHFGIKLDKKEFVEMKTIDEFCLLEKINRIKFLKIDVEGHEIDVLKGSKHMLRGKKIDYIQFEFGGSNIDSKTFIQDFYYLLGKDYKIFRIVKDGVYEIGAYKENFERFMTTNYLAILRNDNN